MNDELIPLLVAVHGGTDWAPSACPTSGSTPGTKSDLFDEAIADFSVDYTDQSERDHEILVKAVRAGKLEVFVQRE